MRTSQTLIFKIAVYLLITTVRANFTFTCRDGQGYQSLKCCQITCSFALTNETECSRTVDLTDGVTRKSVIIEKNQYRVTDDGSLVIPNLFNSMSKFEKEEYFQLENDTVVLCLPLHQSLHSCIRDVISREKVVLFKDNLSIWIPSHDEEFIIDTYIIDESDDIEICKPHFTAIIIYVVGLVCSAIMLALTFFFTLTLKILSHQKNMALICHIGMLCLAYTFSTIKNLIPPQYKDYVCPAVPLAQQFCFLSSFFWLNIQAVILHNVLTSVERANNEKINFKRYLCYGLCAWGVPFLITLVTLIADLLAVKILRPHFITNCWFIIDETETAFLYFYGPMAVSLTINLLLFIHVVFYLKKVAKDVSTVNKNASRQLICLAFKLAVILGFFWMIKVVVWIIGQVGIWFYLDIVTAFQGVFISLMFIGNAKTVKLLCKRCNNCLKKSSTFHQTRESRDNIVSDSRNISLHSLST